jgi:hypothetical protein
MAGPRTPMFVLTAIVYPCALAVLAVGAGLLVDRASGRFLPAVLLPAVGVAALIGVSQLTTDAALTAPATPYVFVGVAIAGFGLSWRRFAASARRWRSRTWQLWLPVGVFAVALAPVLLAGRPTFSAYQVLTDSAFHIMGADFLIRHGQDYAHLDLRNSYGGYINGYYGTGYPSGADTLFGGTAFVLGVPLIWAFQPFNAFVLATAAGPSWLLARRIGLPGAWAALAGLTATVPALVYGYELIASVKEITALPLILTLGALIVLRDRWFRGPPLRAVPFALVGAAGVSALGVGFGGWVLASVLVLGGIALVDVSAGRQRLSQVLLLALAGVVVAAIAAFPTWHHAAASLQTVQTVASSTSPGNLSTPLQAVQVFGTWFSSLYETAPIGVGAVLTDIAIGVTVVAAALGAYHLLRIGQAVLSLWIVGLVVLGTVLVTFATTWVDAKTLMLSSPIILLLAWGGVAGLLRWRQSWAAVPLALCLTGGVIGSDVMQYRATNLAPTARYQALGSLNSKFAGRGPTLFTDFDEYALYELRDLDIGGPDFLVRPPALAHVAQSHGDVVDLDRISPVAFRDYPLIVTRVNPLASRPPAAYHLLVKDHWYEVWGRGRAPTAIVHRSLYADDSVRCERVASVADIAAAKGGHLVAAVAPSVLEIQFAQASPSLAYVHHALFLLPVRGGVRVRFRAPHAGVWDLWLRGEVMPRVAIAIDGKQVTRVSDELSGDDSNPDTIGPIRVRLTAGTQQLTFTRSGSVFAPGAVALARLSRIFLTPRGNGTEGGLVVASAANWRALCDRRLEWVEAIRG